MSEERKDHCFKTNNCGLGVLPHYMDPWAYCYDCDWRNLHFRRRPV